MAAGTADQPMILKIVYDGQWPGPNNSIVTESKAKHKTFP